MVMRYIAGFVITALAVTAAASRVMAQAPRSATEGGRWVGTASGEMRRVGVGPYVLPPLGTEPGGPSDQSGTVITKWKAQIRLKESTSPVEVKDNAGTVVGKLVPLVDDGSTVTLGISGRMTETSHYGDVEHWDYTGSDVAPEDRVASIGGGAFLGGWVYYSLSDRDPLADILPNGGYSLFATPTVLSGFAIKVTRLDAGHSDQPHFNNMRSGATGSWHGGYSLWTWSRMTPAERVARGFGIDGNSISVDSVRKALAATAAAMRGLTSSDPKSYAVANNVIDGRMTGLTMKSLDESTTQSSEWHLEREINVSGSLKRVDRNWRPKKDETVTATATIDPKMQVTGKFRFTLFEVSRERGYALNAGWDTSLDLAFAAGQSGFAAPVETSDGWQIETSGTSATASVEITALDYGAYGKLKAEVNIYGHWYLLDAEGSGKSINVPLDDDNNHIADGWEEVWLGLGSPATDDTDELPATPDAADAASRAGDGLSNYEEYRGFFEEEKWDYGYPGMRDVFIYDELGHGTGFYSKSGLRIHLIRFKEYDSDRVVNFNRGYATAGPQKALHIMDWGLDAGVAGQASVIGTPNVVDWIRIDTVKASYVQGSVSAAEVIAHELGHGTNLPHHGEASKGTICVGGNPMTTGIKGGQYSGDWHCIMRYTSAIQYEGWDGNCYLAPDQQGPRENFCRSRAGTELNAGPQRMEAMYPYPMAGDATVGACMNHLTVRGKARNGG